jgi:hypothetical protein
MLRIRQRWGTAALVGALALGLFTACKKDDAGATGGKSGDTSGASASSDDLSLLPADSELVIGINLKQIQQSPLWKKMVEPKLMSGEAQRRMSELKAKCGIDPMASISSLAVGLKGLDGDKPEGVAVVRGLDKAKTLDCIEKNKDELTKDGTQLTRDGDVVLLKDRRGEPAAFGFINDSTAVAVFGPTASAASVKAVAAGSSSLKSSATFLEMYKKVKTGDSIWMLASGKTMDKLPVKATAAYGSLNVTDGLSLDGRVRFESPDAATQAASLVNAQAKQAAQYVDKAEFTSDGNEVHGSVVVSSQKLTQLTPMLNMLMGGGMGGQ